MQDNKDSAILLGSSLEKPPTWAWESWTVGPCDILAKMNYSLLRE